MKRSCLSIAVALLLVLQVFILPAVSLAGVPGGFSVASAGLSKPAMTTLAVEIFSSPWAVLDHNDPAGSQGKTPRVFVVEAVVRNTGAFPATELIVTLDYNEDPAQNWILLPGEDPERAVDELAPGAVYHAYWLATYPAVIGAGHLYTVTAQAANAVPVSTSQNHYENLGEDTVRTRSFLSTSNSGITQVSTDIVVGATFTILVRYDLGTSPQGLILSPLGNVDFDPGAYRLVASAVRLFNDARTQQQTVHDRLYLPRGELPAFADNAEVTYTFLALLPRDTVVCPYAAVNFQSTSTTSSTARRRITPRFRSVAL